MARPSVVLPLGIKPGDLIAVAALSSGLDAESIGMYERGIAEIEAMGFRTRPSPLTDVSKAHWWAAAPPAEVGRELTDLFRDPDVRAIWSLSGGQFALSYLDEIDYEVIGANPKPLIGMSDIAVLNLAIHSRTGLVTFHADSVVYGLSDWGELANEDRARQAEAYRRVLTSTEPIGLLPALSEWETWRAGTAEGPLVGGMLNRLVRIQASPWAFGPERFDGAILFLEDYNAPTIRVWNDLQALRLSGIFDRIAGLIIGPIEGISILEGTEKTLRDVVLDVVGERGLPILANVNCGHAGPNVPLPLGVRAALDADARTISLVEAAVS
ncbi:MAG TPA: S66 peptidase family protein [Candidatus Limnocylindrales bacterium]|nr:S66 peptidase family protein [Candidatus Limnocylindrales bacterium]